MGIQNEEIISLGGYQSVGDGNIPSEVSTTVTSLSMD